MQTIPWTGIRGVMRHCSGQLRRTSPSYWYPWGDAALQRAVEENKPILLSIGYSACHWCHVMTHESFEDPATAAVMNELFVNIKVDREERPDLDKLYQFAHQTLTQRGGGWPLTMILTPQDQIPFFAGTYFPKQARHGMPPFTEILRRVADYYRDNRAELDTQNQSLLNFMSQVYDVKTADDAKLQPQILDQVRQQLGQHYDREFGGFGSAPKFPHPTNIERLLRHWHASQSNATDLKAREIAEHTLRGMAEGGVYDQLGGGFYRYSVDAEWQIPHFEKMLYDNGPLLALYAEASLAFGNPLFKRTTIETSEWAMREMQSDAGGFYAALDADSEGEEGKFYRWTPQQIREALDTDEYQVLERVFGLDRPANFEGHWHLHTYLDAAEVAETLGIDATKARQRLDHARTKLFALRAQRIAPHRDDKILTAWNALMIKGMAVAGRHLQRKDFIHSATLSVNFIRENLWRDNRLLACYSMGKAQLAAYLDDYAYLIDALLTLLQARWRSSDLQWAIQLADTLLEHYEDKEHGGFYFTADDHEQLIQRPKTYADDAMPAGNGIAAHALLRLGYMLGEQRYLKAAERCVLNALGHIHRTPYAHNAMLLAAEEILYPTRCIIIRGDTQNVNEWQNALAKHYAPRDLVLAIPNDALNLPDSLSSKTPLQQTVAYLCKGQQCSAPLLSLEELLQALY